MVAVPHETPVRRGADATLSVVVPLFNEADNVGELLRRITEVVRGLSVAPADYEIVLVDDGSRDATLELLLAAAHRDPHLRVISLSRNFGHQIAATAGLDAARGDAVVLMDGDLQDPPELIDEFLAKFRDGYDVVYATRRRRAGESRFKLFTAALFYRIIRRLTNVSIPVDTGDFRLMSRRVVARAARLARTAPLHPRARLVGRVQADRDRVRPRRALLGHLEVSGLEDAQVRDRRDHRVQRDPAAARDLVRLRRQRRSRSSSRCIEIGISIFTGYNLPGYTSTIFAILFLGGVQLITIGILGEYIGRDLRRDQRPPALPRRGECRRAGSTSRPTRCRARVPSRGKCARSRCTASSSGVSGCVQPAARSLSIVATVRYWYFPRSTSGISTYSIRGGSRSAANTACARSFQVRSIPEPTL